jgi:hypothetical protein
MWFQAFLLLLATGTIGAAATVTLIAGMRGKWKVAKTAGIVAGLVALGYVTVAAAALTSIQ